MKKHIAEELPARKHAPAAAAPAKAKGGAAPKGGDKKEGGEGEGSEKRIRQAVYDIRYRARREDIDLKAAFSQYMSNSSLSQAERTAVREKLFGKAGGVSEQYIGISEDWAVDGVAGAMYKVFVEGVSKEEPQLELVYERQMEGKEGTKYQVRVLDPKSGRSYVRMANREKITQLRAKGLKVEMTDAGEPYEGRKAKKDYDGDGKVESSSKEHAGAVHNAIQRERGGKPDGQDTRKEDFLWSEANGATGTTSTEGQYKSKITGAGVDNSSRIKVFPQDGSDANAAGGIIQAGTELEGPFLMEKAKSKAQQRFMALVYKKKKEGGEASPEVEDAAKGMSKKEAKKYASTEHEGLPEKKKGKKKKKGEKVNEEAVCPKCGKCPCECDRRDKKTYRDLLKNKIRSMGVRNPILLDDPDEEKVMKAMTSSSAKQVDEGMGLSVGAARLGAKILSNPRTPEAEGAKNLQRNLTDPVGFAVKGALKKASRALLGDKPITAGGGTPDTQRIDNEARRLAAERARRSTMNPDGSPKK